MLDDSSSPATQLGEVTGGRSVKWYALYCKSRHEKKVAKQLEEKEIAHYLPLRREIRQWSDRKKWVEVPLFRGYVFVNIPATLQIPVLETYGAVTFVKFGGKLIPIREEQIESVRVIEKYGVDLQQEDADLQLEDRVRVTAGACKGLEGYLAHKKNTDRFVVVIDSLKLKASVEIERHYLEKIGSPDS